LEQRLQFYTLFLAPAERADAILEMSRPDVWILGEIKDEDRKMGMDTVNMTRFRTVEIDFIADDPGPTLLHCHHQDHEDEGFMGLVTYL
jgi:hypothetical protein